jgi:uncharacterized membrane protein YGL010W
MQEWFDLYGESHQNATNKLIHWICVPSIFWSLIGLLSLIPHAFMESAFPDSWHPYVHFGSVLIVLGWLFYLRTSWKMAIGMLLVSALVLYLVKLVNLNFPEFNWLIYLGVFVVAWIGQFIGHKIEGQKPSFFEDLQFLLIGPAWLLGFIYKRIGLDY